MPAAIHVRAPASSANLGPGFDSFGLALGLYHELTVRFGPSRNSAEPAVTLRQEGEGAGRLPGGEDNAIVRALRACLRAGSYDGPDLFVHSVSEIPLARGLGSSAAAFVAGSAAGQMACARRLDPDRLLADGRAWEGHADNVAACLYGGFTLVSEAGDGGLACARFAPPAGLAAVVAVPDFELPTADSRRALPAHVSRRDVVHAVARAGMVAVALAAGRPELLARGMDDERLHEPYRTRRIPGIGSVRRAAREAGAYGAALSGAGPSILALVPEAGASDVGAAMARAWRAAGAGCRILSLTIDGVGVHAEQMQGEVTT